MNPDISDILESLDRPDRSQHSIVSLSDSTQTFIDHQQLTRFWVSERSAPEVLPWPTELMERVLERLRLQIEKLEDLASQSSDPSTFSHAPGAPPSNLNLTLSVLQSDLSRTQYLIRSLLRCRLSKLSRHALYYLNKHTSASESQDSQASRARTPRPKALILSPSEENFLLTSQALLHQYYNSSFLSTLPPNLQRLDDNAGGINMVEGPDVKTAVFVRCLAERWRKSDPVTTSHSNWLSGTRSYAEDTGNGLDDDDDDDNQGDRDFDFQKGQVWVVRWEDVRKGVLSGKLELL